MVFCPSCPAPALSVHTDNNTSHKLIRLSEIQGMSRLIQTVQVAKRYSNIIFTLKAYFPSREAFTRRKRLLQFLVVCATLVIFHVLSPQVHEKDIHALFPFSKEYYRDSNPKMDCRTSLFPGVMICLPPIQSFEGRLSGTVIFLTEMSHVDMVGFMSGSQYTIGASWNDPCAEHTEDCGKRYIFNSQPPPVAGVYKLEILWLCNFNKSTSVFDRRRRLIYATPLKFINLKSDMQVVALSRNLSVKGAFHELYFMKGVSEEFFLLAIPI